MASVLVKETETKPVFVRSERGQAASETLIALPILALALAGGLCLIYVAFAQIWLERTARESAICLATRTPYRPRSNTEIIQQCRTKAISTLSETLPFGRYEVTRFQITPRGTSAQLRFDVEFNFTKEREPRSRREPRAARRHIALTAISETSQPMILNPRH
jgi:Flp pilus assembly protein TadG